MPGRLFVHKPPADEIAQRTVDLSVNVTDEQQDALNPYGVSCIRKFAGRLLGRVIAIHPGNEFI